MQKQDIFPVMTSEQVPLETPHAERHCCPQPPCQAAQPAQSLASDPPKTCPGLSWSTSKTVAIAGMSQPRRGAKKAGPELKLSETGVICFFTSINFDTCDYAEARAVCVTRDD